MSPGQAPPRHYSARRPRRVAEMVMTAEIKIRGESHYNAESATGGIGMWGRRSGCKADAKTCRVWGDILDAILEAHGIRGSEVDRFRPSSDPMLR